MTASPVVIVGAGLAAARVVEAARSSGFDGAIHMVGAEPQLPYDRPPLSKAWLTDAQAPADALVFPPEQWRDWGVELHLGRAASSVDPTGRRIQLDDGRGLSWSKLVLATGAAPRDLAVPGRALPGVHLLRTRADAASLRVALREAEQVVIVGAGLIGLEVASAARALGRQVTVLELGPAPLQRLASVEVGQRLAAFHREHGVAFRFGTGLAAVQGHGRVEAVLTARGERLPAQLVLLAVGVRPDQAWLRGSGLDGPLGVVVDHLGRTAVPGIFAAGDLAAWRSPTERLLRVESYAHAAGQGATIGRALAGRPEPFIPTVAAGSVQHGRRLAILGEVHGDDRVYLRGRPGELAFVAIHTRAGRITAATSLDRARDLPLLRALVAARATVPDAVLSNPEADLAPWRVTARRVGA